MKRALALALLCCSTLAFADDAKPAPVEPDALDRASISAAMNAVKPDVIACGKTSTAKGAVKVAVKVQPSGDIATVDIKATPDAALGDCVAKAVQKAKFKKTKNGGSFSYPFVF